MYLPRPKPLAACSYGYATAPLGAGMVGDEERFEEQKGKLVSVVGCSVSARRACSGAFCPQL